MQIVKNSLGRRVFMDLGIAGSSPWEGPTLVAWGAGSISELSRELDAILKKNDKIRPKSAIAEGQEVTFRQALLMPTRSEAIGRIVSLILSPAARVLGQIQSPGGRLVGQIKTMAEKSEDGTVEKSEAKPEEAPAAG
jgi:ribosomal protein L10